MKLIERLIEEGGSDSGSRNFVGPKISENVVRLIGRHFPSYVESDSSHKKKTSKNVWYAREFSAPVNPHLLSRRRRYTSANVHMKSGTKAERHFLQLLGRPPVMLHSTLLMS
ncbi:hypothetical protein TNCV_2638831 [Trichonephila clavipes]|nr:hypothetical protein TNCV_2638831 [Trichonephila clavipes]